MVRLLNERQNSLDFCFRPTGVLRGGKRRKLERKKATKEARVLLCDDLCFKDEGKEPQ